jgi:hypothetical protein
LLRLEWDEREPVPCFAPRPDLTTDSQWLAGSARLLSRELRCGLEGFSPQLRELLDVIAQHPDVGFTVTG